MINENKKIKFNNKILPIKNYKLFYKDNLSKKKVQRILIIFLKSKKVKNYLITKDIIVIESLEFDGIEISEYKDLYKVQENNLPIDIRF